MDSLLMCLCEHRVMKILEFMVSFFQIKLNLSLSLYYPKRAKVSWRGLFLRHCACGQHSSFRRNFPRGVSRWQHWVQFDGLEVWFSDLPLQRWTRYTLNTLYAKITVIYEEITGKLIKAIGSALLELLNCLYKLHFCIRNLTLISILFDVSKTNESKWERDQICLIVVNQCLPRKKICVTLHNQTRWEFASKPSERPTHS